MNILNGALSLKSSFDVEELGTILSKEVFGKFKFIGLEESIYDEIPALYLENQFLGLRVELGGYSGYNDENRFTLSIFTCHSLRIGNIDTDLNIANYIFEVCKEKLKDYPDIQIIKPYA